MGSGFRMAASITENLALITSRVTDTYQGAGSARAVKPPRLVAVSKTKPKKAVIEAYKAGQRVFGENYIQELVEKSLDPELQDQCPDIQWHFIGNCQTNKVKDLVKAHKLTIVETITSTKLAGELNKRLAAKKEQAGVPISVFIQVNTSGEANKNGLEPKEALAAAEFIEQSCPNLRLTGLMSASFFWMLIAGFQIYVLLVEVFEPDNCRYVQYYMLGYIAPLLMVLFSLLVDTLFNNVTVYGSADFCWIKGNIHLVLTFLAPVFCIVCVNIYFLSVAVWKIHIHSRDALITHKSRTASLKLYVKGLFGLLFLLGATWSVGILSVTYPSVTITYIFTILNSTQGFFIFIFNCIMNKKIRNEGKELFNMAVSRMLHTKKRTLLSRHESPSSSCSTGSNSSNTDSTMVKEYFLPELPYTTGAVHRDKTKSNLSITYYY